MYFIRFVELNFLWSKVIDDSSRDALLQSVVNRGSKRIFVIRQVAQVSLPAPINDISRDAWAQKVVNVAYKRLFTSRQAPNCRY